MVTLRYGSVCSGIEAATMAWHPLGWEPTFFSEIEAFPSAVLGYHYPSVPNHGDMTRFEEWPDEPIDILVGGTPCQSFSVAGLRQGLADPRGNLMLTYLAIARRYRPRWLVWENVPGVLSSNGGGDFGTLIRGLEECGYHAAWRVLDAQYVRVDGFARAVPQRRRRVFVVGYLGDWRRAAAVLLERESLLGNPAPRREAGEGTSAPTARSVALRGREGGGTAELGDDVGDTLRASTGGGDKPHALTRSVAATLTRGAESQGKGGYAGRRQEDDDNLVAHSLRAEGFDASEDGTGRGTPLIPIDMRQASRGATMTNNRQEGSSGGAPGTGIGKDGDPSPTIASSHVPAIAFNNTGQGWWNESQVASGLRDMSAGSGSKEATVAVALAQQAGGDQTTLGYDPELGTAPTLSANQTPGVHHGWAVRRLTPTECERLQGFPDGFTAVPYRGKPAVDGPRYKALGNSMAVNCMRWIGQRIAHVEALSVEIERAAA